MKLKKVMQKSVVTIQPTGSVKEVAQLMKKKHVGSVIVVDKMNGKERTPIGMITDRDITLAIASNENFSPDLSISKMMSNNLIKSTEEEDIIQALIKMRERGVRRIPVVDHVNNLIGIVSFENLLKVISAKVRNLSLALNDQAVREDLANINIFHLKQT